MILLLVMELSILATLKTSSATCVEFSFTKSDYEYHSSQVPLIILSHELFYPTVLIIVILRHKAMWIQFKRIIDKNARKNLVTLSVENYGILIGTAFILMDALSFTGPSEHISNYCIATQIVCPILSALNQIFNSFENNPYDIRTRIETSTFHKRVKSPAKVFNWTIAIFLVLYSVFATITTRSFLFTHPLASMWIYSIIMRILELTTCMLLSVNYIGKGRSPLAAGQTSVSQLPTSIKKIQEEDEASVSIFFEECSEVDSSKIPKAVKSPRSHRPYKSNNDAISVIKLPQSHRSYKSTNDAINNSSIDNSQASGSIKLIPHKKSNDYSPLFSNENYSELYSINLNHSPDDSQKGIKF